jgi:hypothetical protein
MRAPVNTRATHIRGAYATPQESNANLMRRRLYRNRILLSEGSAWRVQARRDAAFQVLLVMVPV